MNEGAARAHRVGAIHESPLQNPKHKPYPAYKPSGVAWLGDIPAHWEVKRLKFLGSEPLKYGANESAEFIDPELPRFIRITDINPDGSLRDDTFRSLPEEVASPFILKFGDLLFARSGATVGKSFMYRDSWGRACYAGYLIRLRTDLTQAIPEFISYFANSEAYWNWLSSIFIQATIQNVSGEKYANLVLPVPPLPEQRAIAAYLDRETARLDALVAKNERLIELLQEKRTALISHAVTNGNAINKVQKDKSPAPWLFPLRSDWKRQALKYNSYMKGRIGYENLRSEEYTTEGPYLVSSVHFKDGRIDWDNCNHVTQERFEMSPEIILQDHDVLFMKDGAMMGKLAYVDNLPGDACLNSHLLLIRPMRGSYLPKFLLYLLMTDVFKSYMEVERKGTTFFGFSQESMGNYPIALPPIQAQSKICDHIEHETAKIDALVAKVRQAIETLKEYRTALISAVVTGKVDVRGL